MKPAISAGIQGPLDIHSVDSVSADSTLVSVVLYRD